MKKIVIGLVVAFLIITVPIVSIQIYQQMKLSNQYTSLTPEESRMLLTQIEPDLPAGTLIYSLQCFLDTRDPNAHLVLKVPKSEEASWNAYLSNWYSYEAGLSDPALYITERNESYKNSNHYALLNSGDMYERHIFLYPVADQDYIWATLVTEFGLDSITAWIKQP